MSERYSTPEARRAVTVGSATVDIITVVADQDIERITATNVEASFLLLEQGRKIEAESISIHPGGGAVNAGVCFARLGFAVAPLVKLGRDHNAGMVLENFAAEGLEERLVRRSDRLGTGIAVMVASHDRNATIFTFRGANTDIRPEDVPADAFAGSDVVHVSGLSNQSADCYPEIVARARRAGCFVSNNPGIRQLTSRRDTFFAALRDIDLLIVNRVEAEALVPALGARGARLGAMPDSPSDLPTLARRGLVGNGYHVGLVDFMAAVHGAGPRFVSITDGTDGAYLSVEGALFFCPPKPVETAGTAGAGDAFAASLAADLVAGASPEDALRTAAVNAAAVVQVIDTQSSLLTRKMLDAELAGAPPDFRARRLL